MLGPGCSQTSTIDQVDISDAVGKWSFGLRSQRSGLHLAHREFVRMKVHVLYVL